MILIEWLESSAIVIDRFSLDDPSFIGKIDIKDSSTTTPQTSKVVPAYTSLIFDNLVNENPLVGIFMSSGTYWIFANVSKAKL